MAISQRLMKVTQFLRTHSCPRMRTLRWCSFIQLFASVINGKGAGGLQSLKNDLKAIIIGALSKLNNSRRISSEKLSPWAEKRSRATIISQKHPLRRFNFSRLPRRSYISICRKVNLFLRSSQEGFVSRQLNSKQNSIKSLLISTSITLPSIKIGQTNPRKNRTTLVYRLAHYAVHVVGSLWKRILNCLHSKRETGKSSNNAAKQTRCQLSLPL